MNNSLMTPEQHQHLEEIVQKLTERMRSKYIAGAVEHGGNIWDIPTIQLIDEIENELIDGLVYLYTARDKIALLKHESAYEHSILDK